jgi:hypothetical protein
MQGLTQGLIYGLVAVAVLVLVVRRQMALRPINPGSMMRVPAILLVIGLVSDRTLLDRLNSPAGALLLVAGLLIGVAGGVARGLSQRLIWREGVVYTRGTRWTLVLWLATVLLRVGMAALGAAVHAPEGTGEVLLFLAVTLGVQNLLLMRRAGLSFVNRPTAGPAPQEWSSRDRSGRQR